MHVIIRTRQPRRRCPVVPAAASCCPILHNPSSVLLQVVASSFGDSRGAQRQHGLSRWASHWLCWMLDQPICYMAWSGLPRQQPDVLWSVAAHSPILALLSVHLVALPCSLLNDSHACSQGHLNGRHSLPAVLDHYDPSQARVPHVSPMPWSICQNVAGMLSSHIRPSSTSCRSHQV